MRFGRSFVVVLLSRGLGGLARVVVPALLLRLIGADYGHVAVGLSAGYVYFGLFNLGLPQAVTHAVAGGSLSIDGALRRSAQLATTAALVGGASVLAGAAAGFWSFDWLLPFVGIGPALVVQRTAANALLGAGDVTRSARSALVHELVPAGLAVSGATVGMGGPSILALWTLGLIMSAAVSTSWAMSCDGGGSETMPLGGLLRFSWPIHITTLAAFLSYRLDVLIVAALLGTEEAGVYAALVAIAEGLWLVSVAAADVLSVKSASTTDRSDDFVEFVSRIVFAATVGAGIVLVVAARPITDLVSARGEEATLALVAVGATALSVSRVLATHMAAGGQARRNIAGSFGALGVNLVLNVLLIPAFGIAGAAAATAVSYTLTLVSRVAVHRSVNTAAGWFFFVPRPTDVRRMMSVLPGNSSGGGGSGCAAEARSGDGEHALERNL